jgi:hypothetical protein
MITVTRNGRLVTIAVPPEPPPSVVDRFSGIIRALMKKVAERNGKIPDAIVMQIYYRLNLILQRFLALAGRVEAGLVRPYRPRAVRAPDGDGGSAEGSAEGGAEGSNNDGGLGGRKRPPDPYREPAPFPRDWAWVVRYVPYDAAAFGGQLAHLFNDPEMAKLLAGSAGLRRMLRPLMRALAQPPHPALADPPLAGAAEAAAGAPWPCARRGRGAAGAEGGSRMGEVAVAGGGSKIRG